MDKIWNKYINEALINIYLELNRKYDKEEVKKYTMERMAKMAAIGVISPKSLHSTVMKELDSSNQSNTIL